jgi:glutamate N-acetyltransferase / amino-acid N-acetyltransferase
VTAPPPTRFAQLPPYASVLRGSVTLPRGFRASGKHVGIKRARPDLGVLVSDVPAVSAVFFTTNAAAAAPVLVTRDTCRCTAIRAVVVNSGVANASTGAQGHADALTMREVAAGALRLPEDVVAVSSTGVIGDPLPMDLVTPGIRRCVDELHEDGGEHFAEAIRTTDRSDKMLGLEVSTLAGAVHLGFATKGAGMISPKMATTLTFVTTDAVVPHDAWYQMMAEGVRDSFNRISVDAQESTNDMVLGIANGAAGFPLDDAGLARLREALHTGLLTMALAVVADGEGSTTTVRLRVTGAADADEAERVARAIGNSPLVKAAVYGHDANWGRIVSAAGMSLSPARADPFACDIAYGDIRLLEHGEPRTLAAPDQERLEELTRDSELDVSVDLRRGSAETVLFFPDLTHDYVQLNANGRT